MASSVVAKPCLFAQGLKTSTTPRTSTNRPLQDEPVLFPLLCYVKLKASEMLRAAGESSRSSCYSLHMECSECPGKLELRRESNITFWSSGNQEGFQ
ncbi:hypothetical protein Bca4012_049384 [Brassica carinata]|uniref:Uncharacterized protein n=1 Tax=Brassica carinata TaxID=52824 RepID=A0A8X7R1V4_BRACI|nr:hypothetical protein Bca52824_052159 [Brassica carinata]